MNGINSFHKKEREGGKHHGKKRPWIEIERKGEKEGRSGRGKEGRKEKGSGEAGDGKGKGREEGGRDKGKEKWVQLPAKVKPVSREMARSSSFQMGRISPSAIVRERLVHMRHDRVTRALSGLPVANQAPLPNVWITQWYYK